MSYNDYIVVFDENGQPYIEHFSIKGAYSSAKSGLTSAYNKASAKVQGVKNYGVGRGVRVNHKYIAKIGNRYIYDAKELAAAKANQFKSATKNARNTINRNGTLIRSSANKMANKASNAVSSAKEKASEAIVKSNIGFKEAAQLVNAKKEAKNTNKKVQYKPNDSLTITTNHRKTDEERRRDWKNEDIAQENFDKTLLGKGVKAAKNAVDDAAYGAKKGARKIDDAYETAKLRAKYLPYRVKNNLNKNINEAKNKASNAVSSAKEKVSETAAKSKDKKKNKEPWARATMTDGEGNKKEYTNGAALKETAKVAGKVAGAVIKNKTNEKINEIREKAENTAYNTSKAVSKVANKINDTVSDAVYDTKQNVSNIKDAASSKVKAKQYENQANSLNTKLTEMRRANGWKDDTPEIKAVEKQYREAMEQKNYYNKLAKQNYSRATNRW